MSELEKAAIIARHAADMGDYRLAYFTLAKATDDSQPIETDRKMELLSW